eukprot:TRINITY_DN35298_c0_g1_i1.p1 TRINITY_DN35298_c0_g1~~TRINITY_DN35298_c0_g1_i1.p1  ORF type:complete len:143 (-),score=15.31 TRINITY_DN35298_c0_g1_i1:370-798(-)
MFSIDVNSDDTTVAGCLDSIRIMPFKACHQAEVASLFAEGLWSQGDTATLLALQSWFVESKLETDMKDIYSNDVDTSRHSETSLGRMFYVAVDDARNGMVVGCVGVNMCGYKTYGGDADVYTGGCHPSAVCELVRLSVRKDC